MFVFGVGLGVVMQVLVSPCRTPSVLRPRRRDVGHDLLPLDRRLLRHGVFGAIFANVLPGNITSALHGLALPPGFTSGASHAALARLPAPSTAALVSGYSASIRTVFLAAVPVGAVAFLATWLIPQVELKQWPDPAEGVPAVDTAVAWRAHRARGARTAGRSDHRVLRPGRLTRRRRAGPEAWAYRDLRAAGREAPAGRGPSPCRGS